jgi:DNA-directed RNA polymerase subunit RPC12/RpoP
MLIIEYDMDTINPEKRGTEIMKIIGKTKPVVEIGIKSIMSPIFPTEMTCPICGNEIDLWTRDEETHCWVCGYRLFQKENIVH